MPAAFLNGAHDAAHALAWTAGVLAVLLAVAAVALVVTGIAWLLEPTYWATRARLTRWQLARLHARSGRTTGPQ